MVVLIDLDGRVLMANSRFYETIGVNSDDMKTEDKDFKKWVLIDDLPLLETSLFEKLSQGREVKNLPFRLQNKTDRVFDVECSAQKIQKDEQLTGCQMVLRDITERKRLENKLIESIKDVESARTGTILGLAKLAEYRDEDTGVHLERIREYTKILTQELSRSPKYKDYITQKYIDDIYFSSILHDIGKVGIPDSILLKPSKLTDEEFEVIKRHSTIGGDVLSQVNAKVRGQSFLTIGMQIAYFHHEKWNGAGYPKGLKGEDIPLSARIVALADVYDALTSNRIYKKAFSHQKARNIIEKESGEHFDPEIVAAFLENEAEFDRIRSEMQEDPAANLINEFISEYQKAEA
jgi:PAS domain S-box-containing protein